MLNEVRVTNNVIPDRSARFFRARYLVPASILCAVVIVVILVFILVSARSALRSGQNEVDLTRQLLKTSAIERNPTEAVTRAHIHLVRAHRDFARADNRLSYLAPLLTHLSWLPGVGDQVAASPGAAHLAELITRGSLALLDGLHPLTQDFARRRNHGTLSASLALADISRGKRQFGEALGYFSEAKKTRSELAGYTSSEITGPLHTFDHQLPTLRVLSQGLILFPEMLGLHHPFTYLIAYQNPAELRATGGFIGSAGLLTFRDGQASQHFTDTWLRDNLSVPPPDPLTLYNREPGWLFRDSNWSPDFPTTAALERFFAHLDLHWNAPGLINITPRATADGLRATGPFYSPEYHRWITGDNVERLTDYYTHHTRNHGPLRRGSLELQRKQFIQIVASHLFARFESLQPSALIRLARNIGADLVSGDILINFRDPRLQTLLEAAGVTGELRRDSNDFLYIVDSNLSYNKINPYVHLSVDYRVRIRPDRWLASDLTLHFTNVRAPESVYADSFGPGVGRTGVPADYADFVRIYVPDGAALTSQSGWLDPWSPGPAYGKTMFSGYLIVRVGHTRVVHLKYIVPPNVFSWSAGRKYRLVIQHQPGSSIQSLAVAASADGRAIVQRHLSQTRSDWTTTASIRRRPFRALPLAANPIPVVEPGHSLEPHAYLSKPKL